MLRDASPWRIANFTIMTLELIVMDSLKEAMKSKDQAALRTLRSIKAAIQLFRTSGTGETLDAAAEIRILQKMLKQRKESASIFHAQQRPELARADEEEIAILERFLPEPLDMDALDEKLKAIMLQTGAMTVKDMGRVIAKANQELAGRAEGKTIAERVKYLLQA